MKAYLNDDDYENDDFRKEIQNDDEKRKRRIIIMIIIILIILLLITSCSCTSKFFGKIGDLFRNEGSFNIEDGTNDSEVIKNQELTFDADFVEMALSDVRTKISFTYKHIIPNGFTCSTSDADIATCYVSSNYVIVIPKKVGEVTVYLRTTANGKTYEASTKAVIKDANRKISLSSESGTINLAYSKYKDVPYTLIGLSGEVSVTSSDETVAIATVKDGILSITGLKTGTATITLTLQYNGMEYMAKYTLTVTNNKGGSSSSSTGTGKPGSPNTNPGSGSTNPENPSDPGTTIPEKDVYTLEITRPNPDIYYFDVYNDKKPYNIAYEVRKNGMLQENETVNILDKDNDHVKVMVENGKIVIKPDGTVRPGDKVTFTIEAHGEKVPTTITFGVINTFLKTDQTTYDFAYSSVQDSRNFDIDVWGPLFIENMKVTPMDENGTLSICSQDNNTCVYVNVIEISEEYRDYIEIVYGTKEDDYDENGYAKVTNSLPIRIVLKENAPFDELSNVTLKLQIKAKSYKESIEVNPDGPEDSDIITINLTKGYLITLIANNDTIKGQFSNGLDTYKIAIDTDEEIDFSDYLAYGIVEDNDCQYYPIQYYVDSSGTQYLPTKYNYSEETKIDHDLTLYAVYDEPEDIQIGIERMNYYLKGVDLFKNQDYYDKNGKYALIAPGAQGHYIITINNNSSNDIVITGMNLEEDNICLENGCLNMGYIVKHDSDPLDSNTKPTYYYGDSDERYAILNTEENKNSRPNNTRPNSYFNSYQIYFGTEASPTGIIVPHGEAIEISLLWKWVEGEDLYPNDKGEIEKYDEIDTAIGNYAAEQEEGSINDLYNLTIRIDFAESYLWCFKE